MRRRIAEVLDQVAAGEPLAEADLVFLCQQVDPFAWARALARAGASANPTVPQRDADDPEEPPDAA